MPGTYLPGLRKAPSVGKAGSARTHKPGLWVCYSEAGDTFPSRGHPYPSLHPRNSVQGSLILPLPPSRFSTFSSKPSDSSDVCRFLETTQNTWARRLTGRCSWHIMVMLSSIFERSNQHEDTFSPHWHNPGRVSLPPKYLCRRSKN